MKYEEWEIDYYKKFYKKSYVQDEVISWFKERIKKEEKYKNMIETFKKL